METILAHVDDTHIMIWLVVWNMAFIFPNSWNDDPIWRTHIFQRWLNHQWVMSLSGASRIGSPDRCFGTGACHCSVCGGGVAVFGVPGTGESWNRVCFTRWYHGEAWFYGDSMVIWLVVWNMKFIFSFIGNVIIPTDELIFLDGWRKNTNK